MPSNHITSTLTHAKASSFRDDRVRFIYINVAGAYGGLPHALSLAFANPNSCKSSRSTKDETTSARANRRPLRIASRRQKGRVSLKVREMGGYIVLATNLSDTAEQILELYRARWQIKRVFRRLKGLFSFGEPLGTNPNSVKAWFYGKLFLAVLYETAVKQSAFSTDSG